TVPEHPFRPGRSRGELYSSWRGRDKRFVGGKDPCEGPVDDAGYVDILIHNDMIAFVVRMLQEERSALGGRLDEMPGLCLNLAKYQVRVDRKPDKLLLIRDQLQILFAPCVMGSTGTERKRPDVIEWMVLQAAQDAGKVRVVCSGLIVRHVEGAQRLARELVNQHVGHPNIVGGIIAEFKSVQLGGEEHLTLQPSQRHTLADQDMVTKMVREDS
ncbi:MAG: hypothetical protein M1830_005031, partial [Pleopsidium flavum]